MPTYAIVLVLPGELSIDISDSRYGLLFLSIARITNYTLYVMNSENTDEKLFEIIYTYLDPLRVKEISDISEVEAIMVLRLELHMFISDSNTIYLSPLYMPKISLYNSKSLKIPELEPLILPRDPVLYIPNSRIADIYIHTMNITPLITSSHIGISCVMIITKPNVEALHRSLGYYYKQTHINKELIIVASSACKSMLAEIHETTMYYDGSIAVMRNLGNNACDKDYILRWNLGDWYNPGLLSLLAQKANNGENLEKKEYLSFSSIIGFDGDNFMNTYSRNNGWEDILMIKRDKILPFPDIKSSDTIHMISEKNYCKDICVLGCEYISLYVKMNYKSHTLDSSIPRNLQQYYERQIIIKEHGLEIVPYAIGDNTWSNYLYSSYLYGIYSQLVSYIPWGKS